MIARKSSISCDGVPSGVRACRCTITPPSSTTRRASAAYSAGVYGIAGHCSREASAPDMAQVRMTGSSIGAEAIAASRCARPCRRTSRGRRGRAGRRRCRRRPGTSRRRSRRRSPAVPSNANGSASASRMRSTESCTAPERPPRSVSTTTNSSPPSRATRSRSRTQRAQPARDLAQRLVARRVPVRVVDRLEAVEVEHQRARPSATARRPAPARPRACAPARAGWRGRSAGRCRPRGACAGPARRAAVTSS